MCTHLMSVETRESVGSSWIEVIDHYEPTWGLLEKHAALNCEVISLVPYGDFTLFFFFLDFLVLHA